jgi:hypothetical protein
VHDSILINGFEKHARVAALLVSSTAKSLLTKIEYLDATNSGNNYLDCGAVNAAWLTERHEGHVRNQKACCVDVVCYTCALVWLFRHHEDSCNMGPCIDYSQFWHATA